MPKSISIVDLYKSEYPLTLIDVRSPAEFSKGHIPNAINIPLFENNERAEVGTTYKQIGKEEAFLKGLDIIGPKMTAIIKEARKHASGKIVIHCWRGGKRSESIAWLLEMAGMDVLQLEGGYKAYRQYIRKAFGTYNPQFLILTGSTGSGKTHILKELEKRGNQIINLEGIANHKGSAFGDIGEAEQPSTEQFENNLFDMFHQLDFKKRIWLESESRLIGNIVIPDTFWEQMSKSDMIHLQISRDARLNYLVSCYGQYPQQALVQAFQKLHKKLAQHLSEALEALDNNDLEKAAGIALDYYDKYYQKHLDKNKARIKQTIELEEMDFEYICDTLIHTNTLA